MALVTHSLSGKYDELQATLMKAEEAALGEGGGNDEENRAAATDDAEKMMAVRLDLFSRVFIGALWFGFNLAVAIFIFAF